MGLADWQAEAQGLQGLEALVQVRAVNYERPQGPPRQGLAAFCLQRGKQANPFASRQQPRSRFARRRTVLFAPEWLTLFLPASSCASRALQHLRASLWGAGPQSAGLAVREKREETITRKTWRGPDRLESV